MTTTKQLTVQAVPFIVSTATKGGVGAPRLKEIDIGALKENLQRAVAGLAQAFQDIRRVGDYELSELTVGLEVSGEGGVSFIGSATVGASAAIELKFTPAAKKP
jgi:hypothetical protein